MDLNGKVALVTGASSGIGRETAITLAKNGASVIINHNLDDESANSVLKECDKYSSENIVIRTDITKDSEVKKMFSLIKKKYSKLDILVNNAGIFDVSDGVVNLESFQNIWETNFLGHVRIIKYCLEIMNSGKIVNVSSIHGRLGHGRPSAAAYSSLKAALDNYTKNLAKNLAPKILVNAVAPGKVLTPMWGNLSKDEEKELARDHLIKRFIQPSEIAEAILFLLKNDAMCGEILTIDGGMSLKTLG